MKIALDLEGVVADTWGAVLRESDFRDSKPNVYDCDQLDKFLEVSEEIWAERPEVVQLVEPCVPAVAHRLHQEHTLDLVTNRDGHDESIKWWLDAKGIEYRDFHANPASFDKTTLDYDVFIDDAPTIVGNGARILFRDQPWNRDVELGPNDTRIHSLRQIQL